MATFNELAVLIAEPLGRILDVSFREQLKERIRYWRARLIRNTLQKNPTERKHFYSTLTVPMEEVDAAECGLDLNCKVMRSTVDIPEAVRANGIIYDYVGSAEGSHPFRLATRWQIYYKLKDKWAAKAGTIYASILNKRLVVNSDPLLQYVTIEYIAVDPELVSSINCGSTDDDCNFDEEEYPVTADIAQLIVQSVLEVDFGRKSAPKDEEVNLGERPKK